MAILESPYVPPLRNIRPYIGEVTSSLGPEERNALIEAYRESTGKLPVNVNTGADASGLLTLVGLLGLGFVLALGFYNFAIWLTHIYQAEKPPYLIGIIISALAVLAGRLAFWFRAKRRDIYSIVEIASAFVIAYVAWDLNHEKAGALAAALAGAIYVGVRGFDNLDISRKERARAMLRWSDAGAA